MKIYAKDGKGTAIVDCSYIELMCTKTELDILINSLIKFQSKINKYIVQSGNKSDLGFTHMHYQDNNAIWKKDDPDIVVYVDLNRHEKT